MTTIEQLLGITKTRGDATRTDARPAQPVGFSFLFFSDVRSDVNDAEKYAFMRDLTLFGDREGFTAVYFPERHFYEFGSIYANPSIVAAYLIPQTSRIRFRTAGVSLPLHHPASVVESWAMNDVLSGGRVDLGFGSGWSKPDFVLAPDNYERRREICTERIELVRRMWRGETVPFTGAGGEAHAITIYPRPVQPELNVWMLVARSDDGFVQAGRLGYNVFTMLSGIDLEGLGKKIALYREARRAAGFDPATGIVSLTLHTMLIDDPARLDAAVKAPFTSYIRSSMEAHIAAFATPAQRAEGISEAEKAKVLEYAYHRYARTGALFGSVDAASRVVDKAIEAGVDDIACLMDFGVDYAVARESLGALRELVTRYRGRPRAISTVGSRP
jgi:natural product biosynthesis luciferase-like monooxygenase protein